jgi:hypothetical protein
LATKRHALTQLKFIERIRDQGGDAAAAASLWRRLMAEWIYAENFHPEPTDDLSTTFGIAEEELDEDLILSILRELNIDPPPHQFVKGFGPIATPLQVAQFIARCREFADRPTRSDLQPDKGSKKSLKNG